MSFILEVMAPDAFDNLTAFSSAAAFCRIGRRPDLRRPFSGVTGVVDFCAHAHLDKNNINAGCTMVRTSSPSSKLDRLILLRLLVLAIELL